MKLRTKTLLVISMTLAGLVGVLYLVTSSLLSGSIKQAEKQHTLQTVTGLLNIFNQTQEDFSSRFNDWSDWDDTYNFIQDGNQNYIKSNLTPEQLSSLKVNLILYINPEGKLVFGTGFDIEKNKFTPIPELIKNRLNLKDPLLKHSNSADKLTGIISLPQGLMRITSHPILTSKGTGNMRGSIIFGRYLDQDSIQKLEKITASSIQIYSINNTKIFPEFKNILPNLINQSKSKNQSSPIIIKILDENTITGYTLIKDIYNQPAMVLKINLSRDIYAQGEKQAKILIITVIIVGLIFGILTLILIEKLILFRLGVLGNTVKDIGITGDLSKRVIIGGKDELSNLGNNVNNMLESLAETQYTLKQTEAKYRLIFENSTDGIFQTTPEGTYISANMALARIYGYDHPDELINQISDITTELYVDDNRRQELIKLMENKEIINHFESQIYRKDHSVIWITENVRSVRDNTGKILYYEGTVQDITNRKIMEEALKFEQEQSERLLLNILPEPIADRLKMEEEHIADHFPEVTVLFADIVGFTELSSSISPEELVKLLNRIFSKFDNLAEKHGLEKIKTIGDAYMVVGGIPSPRVDHAEAIADMALDMQREITKFKTPNGQPFNIRMGINSGPVIAGVIGIKKFIYDLWGDTVNIASRMESHGLPGQIQVTVNTYCLLKDKYILEERGNIYVKGRGEMETYFLIGKK